MVATIGRERELIQGINFMDKPFAAEINKLLIIKRMNGCTTAGPRCKLGRGTMNGDVVFKVHTSERLRVEKIDTTQNRPHRKHQSRLGWAAGL
jgi:hypothetical protein